MLFSPETWEKNFEMANRAAGNAIFPGVVSFAVFALVGAVGSRLYLRNQVMTRKSSPMGWTICPSSWSL